MRFVAASTTTDSSPVAKPSSSQRSWFSACSRSSLPPAPGAPELLRFARASISSMKTTEGAWARASAKSSRTRFAPRPL